MKRTNSNNILNYFSKKQLKHIEEEECQFLF